MKHFELYNFVCMARNAYFKKLSFLFERAQDTCKTENTLKKIYFWLIRQSKTGLIVSFELLYNFICRVN